MNRNSSPKKQRLSISILLGLFLSVQFLGFFAFPSQVKAQGAPVFDAANFGELVKDGILEVLEASAMGALLNGASYFMRKIAYDTASYIANGGKGQSALVFKKGWGSYLEDVSGNAAASAIDQLGKPFGLDLCKMPSVGFQVDLQIGLRSLYGTPSLDGVGAGPEPSCSFQKLKEGWKNWNDLEAQGEKLSNAFSASLTVSQSDFGVALNAVEQVDRLVAKQRFEKLAERGEGGGFKAVTDYISGDIKTPAEVVKEESKALSGPEQTRLTMSQIAGVYGSGALQVFSMAGSVFLNTLISQGLNNLFTKGLVPNNKGTSAVVDFYAQSILNNKKAVERAFNYLFTAVPKKQTTAYDALTELEACPDAPGLNNCVIDNKLRDVIALAKVEKPLTIREAMDKKYLNKSWPLISPTRDENDDFDCRNKGYCYSNLQKLRKLRVFPIGFELAALRSDPDQPWTLEQVVSGFEDCTIDPVTGKAIPDSKKPFCHLIDPNWIIRLPDARCENKVFGPILLSANTADRREECADITTCITEGPNGECIDDQTYAYCTREKNVWRIGANACQPQFNTCKSYVDNKGTVRSYLSRTLDYGTCTAQAVGCTAYSLAKDTTGWVSTPEVSVDKTLAGEAQVAFFNKNIASYSCLPTDEGTAAFYPVKKDGAAYVKDTDAKTVYLKKAPDYLGCYDIDAATPGVQYPKNAIDLAKLPKKEECTQFASACLPEETQCQSFTPKKGGEPIPGIIGANACKDECVGYDTFKQEPTQFESAKYPLYFIPANGEKCTSEYDGCTEFTNLESGNTGEQLTYFSKIKYCEKPTGSNLKTFYSWEGDQEQGYVLKVHKLRPFTAQDADYVNQLKDASLSAQFIAGTPAYADDRKQELVGNAAVCNEQLYNAYINGTKDQEKFDADCRAFYDEAGKVSYRLLAKTITVSEECAVLRKTAPEFHKDDYIADQKICTDRGGKFENNVCMRCTGGGFFKDNSCVYSAILGEEGSVSCPAEANGCREYTGNAGNNTTPVLKEYFDDTSGTFTLTGWTTDGGGAVKASAESIHVGPDKRSLEITAPTAKRELPATVTEDGWYELSFWVRGTPQALTVSFGPNSDPQVEFTKNPQTNISTPVAINNSWRVYRLGPVYLPKGAKKTSLTFSRNGNTAYFLDTIELRQVTADDNLFRIKDSWKKPVPFGGALINADVPLACDADPTDDLPGFALGCSIYTDSNGKDHNAVGFEQLCRPEAVGCQPFIDTFNTVGTADEEKAHVYNAVCAVPADVSTVTPCKIVVGGKEFGTCAIQIGEKSCTVKDFAVTPQELQTIKPYVGTSTIIIPADTPVNDPVFFTHRKDFVRSEQVLGCQKVAVEEQKVPGSQAASYAVKEEKFVKNNPANYSTILCDATQVGCSEFSENNVKSYFKDPLLSGNTLCEYREVKVGLDTFSGWFKSGVGLCENNPAQLCRPDTADNDCGKKDAKCGKIGELQCYNNFIDQAGQYGIWSNKSNNYTGFVGICGEDQNQCSEVVDPQDTSVQYPKGKPYYVIFDEEVKERQSKCSGVSLDEGCVLFDKTEDPNKKYSSALTYQESRKNGNKVVSPKNPTGQFTGDTNIVLKVDRDRQCSEWLSCSNSMRIKDKDTGEDQRICADYRACVKDQQGKCLSWKPNTHTDAYLSEEDYIARNTDWYADEYVGYSLLNKYQVHYYSYIRVSSTAYAVYKMDESAFEGYPNESCMKTDKTPKEDWIECGFSQDTNGNGKGRCYQGACIYPVTGKFPDKMIASKDNFEQALQALGPERYQCKAFPEPTSPYPDVIAKKVVPLVSVPLGNAKRNTFQTKATGFAEANICQDGDCSCSYTKVQYKGTSEVDYWKKGKDKPYGICQGGDNDGKFCNKNIDCGEILSGSTCAKISKIETREGLHGLCLEEDKSRLINGGVQPACLTWLPVDSGFNGVDNYNNDPAAGYYPSPEYDSEVDGGEVYCTAGATGYEQTYDKKMMIEEIDYVNSYLYLYKELKPYTAATLQGVKDTMKYGPYVNSSKEPLPSDDDVIFGQNENYIKKCFLDKSCDVGKQYTFQQWLYSAMLQNGRDKLPIKSNLSIVWYVGDTSKWVTYAKSAKSFCDKYLTQDNADGTRASVCSLYFTYLSELEAKKIDPYIMPGAANLYADTIKEIYFSPLILPFKFEKESCGDGGFCGYVMDYAHFNEAVLNIAALNTKDNENKVLENYNMKAERNGLGLANDSTNKSYVTYQKKGIIKGNTNKERYAMLISLQSSIDKAKAEGILDIYLGGNEDQNKEALYYAIFYIDFNADGKVIMQADNKPFFAKALGPTNGNFWGSNIPTGNSYDLIKDNPAMASTVVLFPYCTEFEQVYDVNADIGAGKETSKAMTNRVWSGAPAISSLDISSEILPKNTTFKPYASIALRGKDLTQSQMGSYTFTKESVDGRPLNCGEPLIQGLNEYYPYVYQNEEGCGTASTEYYSGANLQDLFDYTSYLFSKYYNNYVLQAQNTKYVSQGEKDYSVDFKKGNQAPQIYSLNPATCFTNGVGKTTCSAGEANNFTVKQRNATNKDYDVNGIPDEDPSKKGYEEAHVATGGFFFADAKFFAFADDNQMPIKRVMINWGDDTPVINMDTYGRYKNHKPYCGAEGEVVGLCGKPGVGGKETIDTPSLLTCATDKECGIVDPSFVCLTKDHKDPAHKLPGKLKDQDAFDVARFGNMPRACEATYFDFAHVYTCSKGNKHRYKVSDPANKLSPATKLRLAAQGVKETDEVCVYKPGVQILDNWDWCNGIDNVITGNPVARHGDVCNAANEPTRFTPYKGQIVVVPDKQ